MLKAKNPVLDLNDTFLNPHLPWGIQNFSAEKQRLLDTQGYLTIDGEFRVGRVVWQEFGRYNPLHEFRKSSVEALIVHGTRDTSVSYDISARAASESPRCTFLSVDSDHGFSPVSMEQKVIELTKDWLLSRDRKG